MSVERWLSDDQQTNIVEATMDVEDLVNELSRASSHGTSNDDWHQEPKPAVVSQSTRNFFVDRNWSVALPEAQPKP